MVAEAQETNKISIGVFVKNNENLARISAVNKKPLRSQNERIRLPLELPYEFVDETIIPNNRNFSNR